MPPLSTKASAAPGSMKMFLNQWSGRAIAM